MKTFTAFCLGVLIGTPISGIFILLAFAAGFLAGGFLR